MRFPAKDVLDFARAGSGRSRVVVFARREAVAGAATLEVPVSAVSVRALVSRKRLLNLSRRNQTLGLMLCNSYVEGECSLFVRRTRS